MSDKENQYQACFSNMHDSWTEYTDVMNRFMNHLDLLGISKFFAGFCHFPTSDSIKLRHVTAIDRASGITIRPDTLRWPFADNDFEEHSMNGRNGRRMDHSIRQIFTNNADFDHLNSCMWVVNSSKRKFKRTQDILITEPTLVDEWGSDIEWNMNEND